MVMTKRDILDDLRAEHPEFTRKQMTALIDDFFEALGASLKANGEVRIPGFGTFVVKARPARTGRNPKSKAPMEIAASKVARFRASKALKENINRPPPAPRKRPASAAPTTETP